jgi:hypothetical protein
VPLVPSAVVFDGGGCPSASFLTTGDPSPVCTACRETLREAAPGGLCGFCAEEAAA